MRRGGDADPESWTRNFRRHITDAAARAGLEKMSCIRRRADDARHGEVLGQKSVNHIRIPAICAGPIIIRDGLCLKEDQRRNFKACED